MGRGQGGRGFRGNGGKARGSEAPINREKHCPFLVRVFCRVGGHNSKEELEASQEHPIDNELHIYTWPDATLREIADLVQASNASIIDSDSRLDFMIVTENRAKRLLTRRAGHVTGGRHSSPDEMKTLVSLQFEPGDMIDIAIGE